MKTSITGSGMSVMYGMGYETLGKYLKQKFSQIQEQNDFKDSAIDHGRLCEPFAKEMFLCYFKLKRVKFNGNYTREIHTEINIIKEEGVGRDNECEKYNIVAMITPDMILGDNTIVEFKCPYRIMMEHKYGNNSKKCADAFIEKYPYGRGDAYTQAMFYAMILKSDKIKTCFFLWDKTDAPAHMVIYHYILRKNDIVYIDFIHNMCKLSDLLKNFDPSIKYMLKNRKEYHTLMLNYMKECLVFKEIIQMRVL
jgi:hypothetical protein